MAKRFFLFFVTIGLICSLAGLSACKSPSSPSGGNPQPVRYTVVYMNGEIKVGEQPYTANSVIDWSEIVNKLTAPDGKEFAYWCTDLAKPEETKISEGYKVTSNITLYAYFKVAATPEETYTVKFVNDDGSLVGEEFKDKKAGAEITVPEAPESENNPGWKFSGWYLNGDDSKTPVSGKYTVKAEDAVDNVITIKAVFVDGTTAVPPESISLEPVSATLEVGETYNLADVKVTYSPGGTNTQREITWSIKTGSESATLDRNLVTAVKEGEVVLTATTANGKTAEFTLTVTEETFTVNFVNDDGSTVVEAFTEQTAETAITVPGETPVSTKEYDVFDGWYLNGNMESPVTGTYTVKAEDAQEGVITIKAVYKQTVHVEKIVSGTDTNGATWFWIGGVKVFAFVTGGSYGDGLWVPVTNHVEVGEGDDPTNYDAKVVLYPDWEKFYLVRANSETTDPDLDMVLDGEGRVYNKTHDIINGEAGTIAETEVYDYVPEGYIRICTKDIAGKGFTYSADKKLVVYVFDRNASGDQVVGWFDTTRYDNSNFYFSLTDAQAEATGQGKTVTDFIFVQLKTSDATSDWANREYQSENIGYYPTETVYYPKNWSTDGH